MYAFKDNYIEDLIIYFKKLDSVKLIKDLFNSSAIVNRFNCVVRILTKKKFKGFKGPIIKIKNLLHRF
jgi:hypothetical protein